jgi:hypothetical protein
VQVPVRFVCVGAGGSIARADDFCYLVVGSLDPHVCVALLPELQHDYLDALKHTVADEVFHFLVTVMKWVVFHVSMSFLSERMLCQHWRRS